MSAKQKPHGAQTPAAGVRGFGQFRKPLALNKKQAYNNGTESG